MDLKNLNVLIFPVDDTILCQSYYSAERNIILSLRRGEVTSLSQLSEPLHQSGLSRNRTSRIVFKFRIKFNICLRFFHMPCILDQCLSNANKHMNCLGSIYIKILTQYVWAENWYYTSLTSSWILLMYVEYIFQ